MYLEHIEKLDRDSLLSEDLLNELFSLDDVYVMEQNRQASLCIICPYFFIMTPSKP